MLDRPTDAAKQYTVDGSLSKSKLSAVMTNGRGNAANGRPLTILALAHRMPYPPDKGDRIRSYNVLRHVAQKARIHLAALADEPPTAQNIEALGQICERMEVIPMARRGRWLSAAAAVARGRSATEGLFYSRRLMRTIRSWTGATQYDAVLAFCSSMAPYAASIGLPTHSTIVDMMDVDSQKWFDYADRAPMPVQSLFRLEGRRVRQLERETLDRSAVTVVSRDEADLLLAINPQAAVHAVPNGVDVDYFCPCGGAQALGQQSDDGSQYDCTFVGALDYRANVDGVTWFCREVWPVIRQRFTAARFAIVGRRPSPAVRRLASQPGIEVFGDVADVRPYLNQTKIVVAPLRIARGVQNKVLEALAAGKPVIATPQAAAGLEVVAGEHLQQADDSAQWASRISSLLGDSSERRRLGKAGRAFVCERRRWENCLKFFDEVVGLGRNTVALGQNSNRASRISGERSTAHAIETPAAVDVLFKTG